MPYICTSDATLSFDTAEELMEAQKAAMESGDLRRINTVFDTSWVDPDPEA